MKNNNFLYGAIIVLVLIVIAVGYSKYAGEHKADTAAITTEETTGTTTAANDQDEDDVKAEAPAPGQEGAATTTAATGEETQAAGDEKAATSDAAPAATETTPAGEEKAPASDDQSSAAPAPAAADSESLLAAPAALQVSVPDLMADRVLGKADAPVTIHEYASFTCPHCAAFANDTLAQVKAQLIDTGRAKLVFHDFPLDKIALKASEMARCAPADKYYDLVEVIFRNQPRWIKSEKPEDALKQLGALAGMDEALMNTCMNNAELENAILERMTRAQNEDKVKATPTFVFKKGDDTESFSGSQPVDRFVETVNKLSPQ